MSDSPKPILPLEELRKSIVFRVLHKKPGAAAAFQGYDPVALKGFVFFCHGSTLGVAVPTGDALINIHGVHPGKSYTLEGDNAIPLFKGNFLTLTVDSAKCDLDDPVCLENFVSLAVDFTRETDGARAALVKDPWAWAEKIIEMSGNAAQLEKPYPYIAELHLLNKLRAAGLLTDPANEYRGPEAASHDFELAGMSLECKSHLHGDADVKNAEITVSSENQLRRTGRKPLYVVYYPMEDAGDLTLAAGVAAFGEPRSVILTKLAKNGFVEGDFAWLRPYHLLCEPLVYEIDDSFPRITPDQFKDGKFPAGITKLVYHVSLQNRPSCPLSAFLAACVAHEPPAFSL